MAPNRGGPPPEGCAFVMELPSDLRVIEAAVGYLADRLRAYQFDGSRLNLNFRVGMAEALANAMIYGNGSDPEKRVRLEVELGPDEVSVQVHDQGPGFDPDRVPDPTLPENLDLGGGRGIFLIRTLMDEVRYNDAGNCVSLVLRRHEPLRRASGE
ncbi:ATP-binding protein [Longimicrobium terrae]|nr:ATP-binding protein [Longimicrobium terrae]